MPANDYSKAAVYDGFTSGTYVEGTWGSTDSGTAWYPVDLPYLKKTVDMYNSTTYDYSEAVGVLTSPGVDTGRIVVLNRATTRWQEVLTSLKCKETPTQFVGGVCLRAPRTPSLLGRGTGYVAVWYDAAQQLVNIGWNDNGTVRTIATAARARNVPSTIAGTTPAQFQPFYWMRARIDQNGSGTDVVSVRVWAETETEPTSWLISGVEVPSGVNAKGTVGVFTISPYATPFDVRHGAFWYWDLANERQRDYFDINTNYSASTFIDSGFGLSRNGSIWEGHFNPTPEQPVSSVAPWVGWAFVSGGTAYDETFSTNERVGVIGPPVRDAEVLFFSDEIGTQTSGNSHEFRVWLRARRRLVSGRLRLEGYAARVKVGTATLQLEKVVYSIGTNTLVTTQLGTNVSIGGVGGGVVPWNGRVRVRFRVVGSTLSVRAWLGSTTEPTTWTTFTDSSSPFVIGQVGLSHTPNVTTVRQFRWTRFDATQVTNGNLTTPTSLAFSSVTDTGLTVSAGKTGDANANAAVGTVAYRLANRLAWTTALTGGSLTGRALTGLAANTEYQVRVSVTDADGLGGGSDEAVVNSTATAIISSERYLYGTITTTNNRVTVGTAAAVATGTAVVVTVPWSNDANGNAAATVRWRVSGGTYGPAVAMTRGATAFTATLSDLAAGTVHNVEVTVTDADGVVGTATQTLTVTTSGNDLLPVSLDADPSDIAATVYARYAYDLNGNGSCAFMYRSVKENLWTAVNPSLVSVDRKTKLFTAVIAGLVPSTSYEVRAVFSDPNGFVAGNDGTLAATFATVGAASQTAKRGKHYVYKVYDWRDNYLGTWPESPEPQFSIHLNGGVSDLAVTLQRRISQVATDPTIDFGNRVDVWAIDYRGDGLGINLVEDDDFSVAGSGWTLGGNAVIDPENGPDGSSCLKIVGSGGQGVTTRSVPVSHSTRVRRNGVWSVEFVNTPLILTAVVKGDGGRLEMAVEAYAADGTLLETSPSPASNVGNEWQKLKLSYQPPLGTAFVRVAFTNRGNGTYRADKVSLLPQERLVYRGRIEAYTPKANADGQSVEIQILGLIATLSDDIVRFKQYVTFQPERDRDKPKSPAADPSQMLRETIDYGLANNNHFELWYDATSVKQTGETVEYTFRDQELRAMFDKIRTLSPSDWHYYAEADGKVVFRGPDDARVHRLRLGVEVMDYENEKTIRNMKNYVILKGRQDADQSEEDRYGSINYETFDQTNIDRYGKRVLFIRDASIQDPTTAELVGDGRLSENNVVEQLAKIVVPDAKDLAYVGGSLRGYNIESIRPGDFVEIIDPVNGPNRTYWDEFLWNNAADEYKSYWDDTGAKVFPERVPIMTVNYRGDQAVLELSERQPSAVGDFLRLVRWMQSQDARGAVEGE